MGKLRFTRPTQLLIATNLVVAAIVAAEILLPVQPATAHAAATSSSAATLPDFGDTGIDAPSLSQLVDLLERPLFYPDRRMPEPEEQKAAAPPPMPLRLKLEGIAIAGGARVAVLRNLSGNGLMQLTEGDSHDGWTLDTLSSNSAIFSRGGQTSELLLDPGTSR
jgi:hypothetical protein